MNYVAAGGASATVSQGAPGVTPWPVDGSRVTQPIAAADSPSIDAFSRWRVSSPVYVFDSNFQYDLQPLLFEAVTTANASVTHDATNRSATLALAAASAGNSAHLQSYEWFRYQAGRSHMVLLTFNFIAATANATKVIGYSAGNNGIELQQVGTAVQLALLSDTSKGDETVLQSAWNLDPMNGSGPSGLTLDLTRTQILVIDLQWLGVGRVRVGFDIGGVLYYVHQFNHANLQTVAYMQTANLPIRTGLTATGSVTASMRFICCSVSSEGGETDVGGYGFCQEGTGTAGNATRAHVLSLRPKTTFNSLANRSKFVLEGIGVFVTGNSAVYWELVLGQAISGTTTFADVNTTYSGVEYNTAGTISGSPTIVVAAGYAPASAGLATSASPPRSLSNRYPISLSAAGAARSLGTLSLLATGLTAASATRVALAWREIR